MSMLGNNLGTFEEKQKGQLFDFQIIALSRSTRSRGSFIISVFINISM